MSRLGRIVPSDKIVDNIGMAYALLERGCVSEVILLLMN